MRARLRRAITVGLSLAGCHDRAPPDGSADAGGSSTTRELGTSGTSTGSTSSSAGGADAEADDGLRFDLGAHITDIVIDEPDCMHPPEIGAVCSAVPNAPRWASICIPGPTEGCLPAETPEIRDLLDTCASNERVACSYREEPTCGPVDGDGAECCYWGTIFCQVPGRPFTVGGAARIAAPAFRDDWCDAWIEASHDDALARAWLFDAWHEHAAIASFARFALQLLALAAPPRFVEGALRAAVDEREHATLFFGLARAHGGAALGPGMLDVRGALAGADDPTAVVVATVREGCIAETISALQLQRACATCTDTRLRTALARVLEQELQHVELAWSFVAWAYARGDGRTRAAVIAAFAEAERWIPRGPDVEPADTERWRRQGRITRADALTIARHTLHTIVEPAARELIARTPAVQPITAIRGS